MRAGIKVSSQIAMMLYMLCIDFLRLSLMVLWHGSALSAIPILVFCFILMIRRYGESFNNF